MIRFAKPDDATDIVRLIKELARFEGQPDAAIVTPEGLRRQLQSERPPFECLIAEEGGTVVAFALYLQAYSTWQGKPYMHLEDIFVVPEQRSAGIGKALFQMLQEICLARSYGRLEFQVLDWNKRAIRFYTSLGAEPLEEWTKYRLSGEALRNW